MYPRSIERCLRLSRDVGLYRMKSIRSHCALLELVYFSIHRWSGQADRRDQPNGIAASTLLSLEFCMMIGCTAPNVTGTNREACMTCTRCEGLMVSDDLIDIRESHHPMWTIGYRCLSCGNVVDRLILKHRGTHASVRRNAAAPPEKTGLFDLVKLTA
jgi:hypothetical protein